MPTDEKRAALFDLDGVLTDTAELHYQSWLAIARELGVPFDRRRNDALRGVSRETSLAILLGQRHERFSPQQRAELLTRKNDDYLRRVAQMSPADLHPGARPLLESLRARGVALAVASSSRNALCVLERLAIMDLLDAVVDGNDAPRSKPDPMVFLLAAERLGAAPRRCVVIEDAASGVAAARSAGMRVVGIGPPERVGDADCVVPSVAKLTIDELLSLLA
ncbi:MAG: beta-phosphoglucomutase [Phycisphaerae bacterium]|jgi:beta-phosphoglucomutase